MQTKRTTIILDEESGAAARQLASHYGCTVSEAIRRSLIAQKESVTGVARRVRQQRGRALRRLFAIFEGNDAAEEVRRLKAEDRGF
jgi:hypothetical protein